MAAPALRRVPRALEAERPEEAGEAEHPLDPIGAGDEAEGVAVGRGGSRPSDEQVDSRRVDERQAAEVDHDGVEPEVADGAQVAVEYGRRGDVELADRSDGDRVAVGVDRGGQRRRGSGHRALEPTGARGTGMDRGIEHGQAFREMGRTGDPPLRPARSAAAVHLSGGRADLSPRYARAAN